MDSPVRDTPAVGGRATKPPRASLALEQFLGAKAFAVAGSVIVIIAVVLFLKYAYDQGWIQMISPTVRCLMGAGFGILLIAAGEGVRRKIGAFASSGLTATGLATLYATVLIARHVFELLGPGLSFAMLLGVTLLGIVLGAKDRRLFTVYISLAAAYAVPFIVGAVDPSPHVLPSYLFSLLLLGLALAGALGGAFRSLRPVVWGATAVLGGLWIAWIGPHQLWIPLVFLAGVWALVHAELCLTVLMRRSSWKPAAVAQAAPRDFASWLAAIPEPSVSFSATVWAAVSAIVVVRRTDESLQSLPAFALVLACGLLAWRIAPTLNVLRGVVDTARTALGASLTVQSAGLLIAAIALEFSGSDQDLAWLVLGAAACVLGRRLEARPLLVYGLITLGILFVRIAVEWIGLGSADVSVFGPFSGGPWTLKAIGLAAAMLVGALCSDLIERSLRRFLVGTAALVLLVAPITPGAEAGGVALVWASLAVLALIGSGGRRWLGLDLYAIVIATFATLPVLAAFAEYMRAEVGRSVFLLAAGLAIAVQVVLADLVRRDLIAPILKRVYPVPVACAVVLLSIAPLTPQTTASTMTLIWAGLTGLLVAVAWRSRWLSLDVFAGALGTAAVLPWIVHLILNDREIESLVWNPTLAGGGAVAAALCLSSYSLFRSRSLGAAPGILRRVFGHSLCTLGVLTLLAATSIEAIRADSVLIPSETAWAAFLCIWWAAFGLVALGASRAGTLDRVRVANLSLIEFAGVMALVSPLPWLVHLILEYREDASFVWNLTLGSGAAATIGLWFAAYALVNRPAVGGPADHQRLVFGNALGAAGALVLLIATSIEAARAGQLYIEDETARQALLSIWWAIYGVMGLVFGSIQRMKTVRLACLCLIGFAALKVVVYDLTNVSPLWRIASSLALGMLMLLIGVAYARSMQRSKGGHTGQTRQADSEVNPSEAQ
ncbi:MAG: DUF2339 domain-containing protein [Phycisphaerales bacterium]